MRIGLFSDIHFQPKGLDRIISTGDWIIDEFKRQRVDRVHCLGDVLNTREEVDVGAQSAALAFFRRLAEAFPVDVILGNHDMNLKHARKVSSLDGVSLHPRITLHRDVCIVRHKEEGGGEHIALMLPYHEDQSEIVKAIQTMQSKASPELLKQVVAYGHLGINGAVKITRYNSRFTGAVGPDTFAPFRRTFTGHFHVHQELAHNVVYLGSPLQFNFGDAGDTRGVVVYDTALDTWQHVVNPHHDAFCIIGQDEINGVLAQPERYRNTFITVVYDDVVTEDKHEEIRQALMNIGVLDVKRESVVDRAIREHQVEVGAVKATSVVDLVEPFVQSVLKADSTLDPKVTVAFGRSVIQKVNSTFQDVADTGVAFEAKLGRISMRNFMGVQDEVVVDFTAMPDGVWFFDGKVGAGKSTVLEALSWCLFGEFIRSDMLADDAVNDKVNRDCLVRVEFQNGYSFWRFRKAGIEVDGVKLSGTGVRVFHNGEYQAKLEKGDPRATQGAINDLLGINHSALTKAIVLGQSLATNFISSGEKERRAILEGMLGLERFDAYLAEVRDLKKQLLAEGEQQENIQRLKAAELARITDAIAGIDRQVADARVDHQRRLDAAAQVVHDGRERLKAEKEAVKKVVAACEAREREASKAMDEARAKVAAFDLTAKKQAAEWRAELAKAEAEFLVPLTAIKQRRDTQLAGLKAELESYQKRETDAKAQLSSLVAPDARAIDEADEKIWKLGCRISHSQMQHQSFEAHREDARRKAEPIQAEIKRLQKLREAGGATEHCPTCKQPVDVKALGELIEAENKKLNELASHLQFQKTLADAALVDEDKAKKEMAELEAKAPRKEHLAAYEATKSQLDKTLADTAVLIAGIAERARAVAAAADEEARRAAKDLTGKMTVEEMLGITATTMDAFRQKAAKAEASFDDAAYQAALEAARLATTVWNDATMQFSQDTHAAEENVRKLEHAITEGEALLNKLKGEDPAALLLETRSRQEGDWQRVSGELESSKRMSVTISQKMTYVTFWDKAFAAKGGMRSYLLEDSVDALNQVIDGYMQTLSPQGLGLHFNPDLTVVERYGKRSGGQRKITDIAVLLGMREVVSQRSRFHAGFLFLDEIFDALDPEHRKLVQDLLVTLAQRIPKVFVITHVPFTGISVTGTLPTELTDKGTKITVKTV